MTVRSRFLSAAAVALWMAHPLLAQEPAKLGVDPGRPMPPRPEVSANQKIANTIAEHLRQSGQLRRYTIDVGFRNGTAELAGTVADQPQREEALRIAQGVPGVERILDHLAVAGSGPILQVNSDVPPPLPPEQRLQPRPPGVNANGGPVQEPLPLFQAAPASPYDVNPPHMPPYSWPTYAPYNNYSRVGYPLNYPYNAWPFIGPCYPFPKIPLGWRSVKLEWQDGHWWFSKVASPHDWWRVRYW